MKKYKKLDYNEQDLESLSNSDLKKLSDYLDVEVNYLTDIGSGFSINSESVFALTIEHIRDGAFKYKKKVYDFDSAETHEIITNIEKHLLEQLKNPLIFPNLIP